MSEDIVHATFDTVSVTRGGMSPAGRLRQMFSRSRFVACVQALDFVLLFVMALVWSDTFTIHAPPGSRLLPLLVAPLAATSVHCVFQRFRLYDFAVLTDYWDSVTRAVGAGMIAFVPFVIPEMLVLDID